MCGIAGCIGENSIIYVVSALNRLQNRGYDSAGISTIIDNSFITRKYVSNIGESAMTNINNDDITIKNSNIAIGHTRWATHGPKTLNNCHPHHDISNRFELVHNGIIENYDVLKKELENNNYHFYGETDTEVVVNYIHYLSTKGYDFTKVNNTLTGSWAIVFLDIQNPNRIYYMKNGSPLLVGFNEKRTKIMLVSELSGFDSDISSYCPISDNDCGYIEDGVLHSSKTNIFDKIPHEDFINTPHPYSHWTIKEIYDQPKVIEKLLSIRLDGYNILFPELISIEEKLKNIEHIIFLGCGTSYHAAQIGVKFFREFKIYATVEVIDGADFEESDIPYKRSTILILLSQSGETRDLYRALEIGKKANLTTIGIINVENSLIAREVDFVLYTKAGREYAVASTKSFTNQVIMLLLLSIWMNSSHSEKIKYLDSLKNLTNDFEEIINQSIYQIPCVLDMFKDKNDCFILGKHIGEWIGKEGSLKIKEITYVHCEGYSAASLKHGPFALLYHDVPVILLANNDKFFSKIENVTSEVKARYAKIILITNKFTSNKNIDHIFYFETDSVLFPILSIVPLQILAYQLSIYLGHNPDYPRNLAKVVTVE